jgi:hypothetical protein
MVSDAVVLAHPTKSLMHHVNLGTAGVKVSRVALGCLTFGSQQ